MSILDMIEEKERTSRLESRASRMKQGVPQGVLNEMEGNALEFDLEVLAREFPMETLWYNTVCLKREFWCNLKIYRKSVKKCKKVKFC